MSARPRRAFVLGSVHMDLVTSAPRTPRRGESVVGTGFRLSPGGKAGFQAAQLAAAGVEAHLISQVGDDAFGKAIQKALKSAGVQTDALTVDSESPTGVSTIFAAGGEYSSIIVPGAGDQIDSSLIAQSVEDATVNDVLILQLELQEELSLAAARAFPGQIVLNAAPMPEVRSEVLERLLRVSFTLVLNSVEASRLTGRSVNSLDSAKDAAEAIVKAFGSREVVITLGARGAVAIAGNDAAAVSAFLVVPKDTVGAGDAFLGTYLEARMSAHSLDASVRRANAAGAIAASRGTTYESMPTHDEVEEFLAARGEFGVPQVV